MMSSMRRKPWLTLFFDHLPIAARASRLMGRTAASLLGSAGTAPATHPPSPANGSGVGGLDRGDRDGAVIGNGDDDIKFVGVVDDR
jgi:hypothetical protein